jgi:NDP-sugar pyrophosphorylase family protein
METVPSTKVPLSSKGAVLKGAVIIGEGSFVAAGAYLRGGVYLGSNCIVGPSCEMKSSFMLGGSKLAHFNFVGDLSLARCVGRRVRTSFRYAYGS